MLLKVISLIDETKFSVIGFSNKTMKYGVTQTRALESLDPDSTPVRYMQKTI